jgi:Ser/Thr protein kinase RdoA (MazF antagonist)
MLRAAALRFWLSRLHDFHRPRTGDIVVRRNPDDYRTILHARISGKQEQICDAFLEPFRLATPGQAG